jgi:hypothetical protein
MEQKEHGFATCFEAIDEVAVPEYYRLYVSNGPLTLGYLKRKQQEHFSLLESGKGGFSQAGGIHQLTTSSRQEVAHVLQSRWSHVENQLWEVVKWSEAVVGPYVQEHRERELRRIRESLQEGLFSRYYEVSLCRWSSEPWFFFDLEITPSHLSLKLENVQGEQETDAILREDGASVRKFLRTYREEGWRLYRQLYARTGN